MELFEAIHNRRTIRKFTADRPTKNDLEIILDAARMAPSAHNKQMWHFIVISNSELKEQLSHFVAEKYDEISSYTNDEEDLKKVKYSKGYATFFNRAPIVIAVLMTPFTNTTEKLVRSMGANEQEMMRLRPKPELQSIGAAIQNMSLAAYALGYGTCWMTAPVMAYKEMEKLLEVNEPEQLVALVCLGKSDNGHSDLALKNKKKLEEIVTYID